MPQEKADAIPLPLEFIRLVRLGVRAHYRENAGDASGYKQAMDLYLAAMGRLKMRYVEPQQSLRRLWPQDIPRSQAFRGDRPQWPSNYPV